LLPVKAELKNLDGLKRELTISVEADTVNQKMNSALQEVRKKAKIDGFRPGKTPMSIIESNYGDQVRADVIEELIKETYPKAVQEHDLKVASYPSVQDLNFSDDGTLTYVAQVEVMPEIESINSDGLTVEKTTVEVKDDEVDAYTEHIRRQFAEERPLTRAIEENDLVTADLKKIKDPKMAMEREEFPGSVIDLSSGATLPGFKEQLRGKNVGDVAEVTISYPEDYPEQSFAGAEITYEVTVKEIKERIMPEMNDSLAKMTGQAETLLELRQKLREDLTRQKEDQNNRAVRSQIITQMNEKNEITIPEGMINNYLDQVVEDQKRQNENLDEEEIRTSFRPIGDSNMRWNMIYHKLAETESIQVSTEDTENLIKRFADNYQMTVEQAKQALSQSGRIADMRESILEEKVLDWLVAKSKVVEVAETTESK
jgi:trigger factor